MAQNETPELVEVAGERVYKIAPELTVVAGEMVYRIHSRIHQHLCSFCPLVDQHCNDECGAGYCFVREDEWHKIRLQNS